MVVSVSNGAHVITLSGTRYPSFHLRRYLSVSSHGWKGDRCMYSSRPRRSTEPKVRKQRETYRRRVGRRHVCPKAKAVEWRAQSADGSTTIVSKICRWRERGKHAIKDCSEWQILLPLLRVTGIVGNHLGWG